MQICDLYDFATQQNIEVFHFPMEENRSMSIVSDEGSCYIGMDTSVLDDNMQERVHLGHEIGHCVTGSFYNHHSNFDCRQKHENRADKWAIKKLIPVDELDEAVEAGCTEIWELAERFGVTEQFMRKALCYYVNGNLATELYFG